MNRAPSTARRGLSAAVLLLAAAASSAAPHEAVYTGNMFDPKTFQWPGEEDKPWHQVGWTRDQVLGNETLRGLLHPSEERRLQSGQAASDCGAETDEPCCIRCDNLPTCLRLRNNYIEDLYYPTETNIMGSCQNIENRVNRLADSIFGPEKTFRDSERCRELVLDYICLYWGSKSAMYENKCDLPKHEGQLAKPPCRSFCTQVAEVCANSVDYMQICSNVKCPPIDQECTPGDNDVTPDEACRIYQYRSPYSAAPRPAHCAALGVAAAAVMAT